MLADAICYCKMTPFMRLDGVTSLLLLKDVTNTRKRMRRSLSIGGSSLVQWRKVESSYGLRMRFRRLLCVRIEINRALDLIFFTIDL